MTSLEWDNFLFFFFFLDMLGFEVLEIFCLHLKRDPFPEGARAVLQLQASHQSWIPLSSASLSLGP